MQTQIHSLLILKKLATQVAKSRLALSCVTLASLLALSSIASADDLKLARGSLTLAKPAGWEKVEVRSSIIEAELAVPKVEGDEENGRITFMAAGGGVDANIARWKNQFVPAEGQDEVASEVEKKTIGEATVHLVDLQGNFKSQPRGPLGPTELKEDYRMLAAIIVQDNGRQYFVKLVGPAKTISENATAFEEMIKSLKIDK